MTLRPEEFSTLEYIIIEEMVLGVLFKLKFSGILPWHAGHQLYEYTNSTLAEGESLQAQYMEKGRDPKTSQRWKWKPSSSLEVKSWILRNC